MVLREFPFQTFPDGKYNSFIDSLQLMKTKTKMVHFLYTKYDKICFNSYIKNEGTSYMIHMSHYFKGTNC